MAIPIHRDPKLEAGEMGFCCIIMTRPVGPIPYVSNKKGRTRGAPLHVIGGKSNVWRIGNCGGHRDGRIFYALSYERRGSTDQHRVSV